MRSDSRFLAAIALCWLGCGAVRASSVPLGGKNDDPAPLEAAMPAAAASAEAPALTPEEEQAAEEVEIQASAVAASTKASAEPAKGAAVGAFALRPYAAGQSWTRVVDLEMDVKMGPGGALSMRMVSHQEARFEVLAATNGTLDKVVIEYPIDRSTMTVMGNEQKEPDDLQGKRYVVTYAQGKPDVRGAGGGAPPKKELDSVQDDAREPLEMALALKELAQLSAKGRGDFSTAGAISLAGGEDDDTKIGSAKASLRQLMPAGPSGGARSALIELAYQLTNDVGDDLDIIAQLKGTLVVTDAPARYLSVSLQGPLELRPTDNSGMDGAGTTKVSISYKY
ncbi:MAG TPA: hypothetical protein VIW29_21390 [Polyangiaceae bacterium]